MSKRTQHAQPLLVPIYAPSIVRCEPEVEGSDDKFRIVLACETPFERWFGMLQLDCSPEAVNLSRMNNNGPLLCDHVREDIVGAFDTAVAGGGVVVGEGRWSRSSRAAEVRQDVKDRIRTHVSPGLRIHELILVESKEGEPPLYRATKWTPEEGSIVSVAAMDELEITAAGEQSTDPWKSDTIKDLLAAAAIRANEEVPEMGDKLIKTDSDPGLLVEAAGDAIPPTPPAVLPATVGADRTDEAHKAELGRQAQIRGIAQRLGADVAAVNKAIAENVSAEQFMLDQLDERRTPGTTASAEDIGMTANDVSRFSLVSLAAYGAEGPADRARMLAARGSSSGPSLGLTLEACAAARQMQDNPRGEFTLPGEVIRATGQITDPSSGGFLVDRNRGSMIDILTAATKILQLGAFPLGNLVGDVELPRLDAGLTGYVIDEEDEVTESSLVWGLLTLRAKAVAARAKMTRSLLKQTSMDVEMLYRTWLALAIALKMDSLAIIGTGGRTQPVGILNTTGIGAETGGTDGLAPAWGHLVGLETEVDQDNALGGRLGYLTNGKMRGSLKRTPQHATANVGGWIWQPFPGSTDPTVGMVNGYPAHVSNQVPGDLAKGSSGEVCSAIIFGNWLDALIATWGGIDLTVDPYSSSSRGIVQLTAFFDFDFAVTRPSSFAAMVDALEAA
ncbi:MAG: phage major capsid protein [Gammaproteobacteria bacterium]|nr:phage major capsid protein [Gammaproteobacteria bacterium]